MFFVNQGMVERAICCYEDHFDLNFDGKKIKDCIEECRNVCSMLHSDDELKNFAEKLLLSVEDTFGFTGLRVYHSVNKDIFGNSMLSLKYDKLIDDIKKFVDDFLKENDLILTLDVYLLRIYCKEFYRKHYGLLDIDNCLDLYSLVNTIRLTGYDVKMINALKSLIIQELHLCGGYYYLDKGLDNVVTLSDLYVHLAEELGDNTVFRGHQLFYDYDGYGHTVYSI